MLICCSLISLDTLACLCLYHRFVKITVLGKVNNKNLIEKKNVKFTKNSSPCVLCTIQNNADTKNISLVEKQTFLHIASKNRNLITEFFITDPISSQKINDIYNFKYKQRNSRH